MSARQRAHTALTLTLVVLAAASWTVDALFAQAVIVGVVLAISAYLLPRQWRDVRRERGEP